MTSQLQGDIRQYYRDIESLLVCDAKTKKQFMAELRNDVQSFISESEGNASMEDIRKYFGPPEGIANGFLESLSSKDIKRAINWKKVVLIGVGIVLLIAALYMAISVIDGHLAATGHGGFSLVEH